MWEAVGGYTCFLLRPLPRYCPLTRRASPYASYVWQAENENAAIGTNGCTFWQYNPFETYQTSGTIFENTELLDPGRVRFENQGEGPRGGETLASLEHSNTSD